MQITNVIKPYGFIIINSEAVHVRRKTRLTRVTDIRSSLNTAVSLAYIVTTAWSTQLPVLPPITTDRHDCDVNAIMARRRKYRKIGSRCFC